MEFATPLETKVAGGASQDDVLVAEVVRQLQAP